MRQQITVQRITVSWPKERRGAEAANARAGLAGAFPLPHGTTGAGPVLVHRVRMRDEDGYRVEETFDPFAERVPREFGLRFEEHDGLLVVHRTSVDDAFPRRRPRELFRIHPGAFARYRANHRFITSSGRWWYALWTFNIGYGPLPAGAFVDMESSTHVDEQVSLYGDARRRRRAKPDTR
ncbi:hypothetical protein HDA32_005903 [Spinactinospora alkalitolerans]|uniref:Uncharacterized protein n=1 Tax=Spinactinospora alkalitolerans TaxID=687207 RepID=A0A852U7D2_9ACTN|nr:hypothetical protein [Spinactinospora alkalitolerans]NYE50783.1 hypothetical protein [Spinactinospora alkalitolerans]